MRWSWSLGQLAGIRVQVHWTFLILIGWVVLQHVSRGASAVEVVHGVLLVLAVFGCVVLHELGHALTARRFGIATRDITLLPIGGVARLERMPERPLEELLVAAAGPGVNVVIAGVLAAGLQLFGDVDPLTTALAVDGTFVAQLMWINVILVAFNLLPAFPMDGGRILRGILSMRLAFARATAIAALVGQLMAILFGVAGLMGGNPFLVFIAVFVYLGAQAETRYAQTRSVLEGVTVADAMTTRFQVLRSDTALGAAAEELLTGGQEDFPIVRNGGLEGMLLRRDLVTAVRARKHEVAVADLMRTDCVVAEADDSLHATLMKMRAARCSSAPVVRLGIVVGLLTLESVADHVTLGQATRRGERAGLASIFATD
jgi:Zn-dependent protease/CBS domain-containing protein